MGKSRNSRKGVKATKKDSYKKMGNSLKTCCICCNEKLPCKVIKKIITMQEISAIKNEFYSAI